MTIMTGTTTGPRVIAAPDTGESWHAPTDGQLAHLDETFTLAEMMAEFRRRWNRGDEGFWRVWGHACEEALMELDMLRREVAEGAPGGDPAA